MIAAARENLPPVAARSRFVGQSGEITSGVHYIATPGHSPSHAAILFTSGNEQLMHMGDIAHNPVTSLQHPDWTPVFDYEPAQAIKSRKAILDQVATDRVAAMGYHFPFPAIGRARRYDHGLPLGTGPVGTGSKRTTSPRRHAMPSAPALWFAAASGSSLTSGTAQRTGQERTGRSAGQAVLPASSPQSARANHWSDPRPVRNLHQTYRSVTLWSMAMRAIEAKIFSGYGRLRQIEFAGHNPQGTGCWFALRPRASAARSHDPVGCTSSGQGAAGARQRGRPSVIEDAGDSELAGGEARVADVHGAIRRG